MMELFDDFRDIEFPRNPYIVYIIYIVKDAEEIPIYVGESIRNIGRFGDYVSANFTAPTDFKVGEAVKYILNCRYNVRIKYKETLDRKNKEREILSDLRRRYSLLNDLPGYDPKTADERKERLKIHDFIRGLFQEEFEGENTNSKNASSSNEVSHETLPEVKKSLADLYITDPVQKDLFLHRATKFKQWANYIAGLVLTQEGKEEFRPIEIREILRNKLIPNHFNCPGAKESSLLTQDVEINSDYHDGLPCLQRIKRTTRYRFVGFNIQNL